MEEVFGEPLAEIERAFRSWALGLERVSEVGDASGGSLGVPLGPGEGDGPEVEGLTGPVGVEGRGDDRENRIKLGDVILSIDGERTPTLDALYRVLGEREPDEVVAVEVRRGTLRRVVRVRLVEPGSFE
jgi:S1-C subfamily serine protease